MRAAIWILVAGALTSHLAMAFVAPSVHSHPVTWLEAKKNGIHKSGARLGGRITGK